MNSLTPSAHHIEVRIRVSVLSNALYTSVFNPPNTILYKVLIYMSIALIKVGHRSNEPAVNS